jgi:hypothetical protein
VIVKEKEAAKELYKLGEKEYVVALVDKTLLYSL